MGPDGTLYAAEMATGNLDTEPFLSPGSGRVVRQNGPDGLDEVLTDVAYPVTLGFDPDGAIRITRLNDGLPRSAPELRQSGGHCRGLLGHQQVACSGKLDANRVRGTTTGRSPRSGRTAARSRLR